MLLTPSSWLHLPTPLPVTGFGVKVSKFLKLIHNKYIEFKLSDQKTFSFDWNSQHMSTFRFSNLCHYEFGKIVVIVTKLSIIFRISIFTEHASDGWGSSYRDLDDPGKLLFGVAVIDSSGASVTHIVGGATALVAAAILG